MRLFVAIDLETTGLNPAEHEIIEIAWVRFERGAVVESFSSLVRPKQPIPPRITELTGISNDEVASAPSIEEVLPGVLEALSGRTVVAHNASFDRGFLETAASKMGLAVMDVAWGIVWKQRGVRGQDSRATRSPTSAGGLGYPWGKNIGRWRMLRPQGRSGYSLSRRARSPSRT